MFTYIQIHGYFVVPPILILGALYWPLIGRREVLKMVWLVSMATIWTTPWDNFILSHDGWNYPPGSILGRIGYIPLEEHLFFILQPILLVLLHCIFTHGRLIPFDFESASPDPERPTSTANDTSDLKCRSNDQNSEENRVDGLMKEQSNGINGFTKQCHGGDENTKQSKHHEDVSANDAASSLERIAMIQTLPRRPLAAGIWILVTVLGLTLVLESHGFIELRESSGVELFRGWGRKAFYQGWILFWISPIISFLVYLGGRLTRHDLWTLVVGTGWLWVVDTIALRSGSWAISKETTFGLEVWPGLPVEEAIFFFLTSYLVVLASSLISHLHTLLLLSPDLSPCPPSALNQHINLLAAVAYNPPLIEERILVGLRDAEKTLAKGSKSFDVAKLAFGREMRLGLVVVYAWCRVTDNLIDEPYVNTTAGINDTTLDTVRRQTLAAIRQHLLETYNHEQGEHRPGYPAHSYPSRAASLDNILDAIPHLTASDRSAFHLFSSLIPRLIPIYPFLELCNGYETDLSFPPHQLSLAEASKIDFDLEGCLPIKTFGDLLTYADDVAGSIASAICYLSWSVLTASANERTPSARPVEQYTFARALHAESSAPLTPASQKTDTDSDIDTRLLVIRSAREMGRALQLVNISRDIVKDALISRIYVPLSMFPSASVLFPILFPAVSPSSATTMPTTHTPGHKTPPSQAGPGCGPIDYKTYTIPLLDRADQMRLDSFPAIDSLPRTARGGTRAMIASYFEIGVAIRDQNGRIDERGVKVSKLRRVTKALGAMWGV